MDWIVVANASKARIFKRANRKSLEEVSDLVHPAGRLHARDITSAPDGRQAGSGGRKHAVQSRTDPKETEAITFAREVAEYLARAHAEQPFKELVLVAPPHFLGLLRREVEGSVGAKVARTIDKNLVEADLSDLATALAH